MPHAREPMDKDTTTSAPVELLILDLSGTELAIRLETVREVLRAVLITPLPDAPPALEGIFSLRGDAVVVYDLRVRFGLPVRRLHPEDRLVVLWTGERLAAIRCERADRIVQVPASSLVEAAELRHAGRGVAGAARLSSGVVLIHDPATFLDEAERMQLDAALDGAAP